jgi:hypothetical protein
MHLSLVVGWVVGRVQGGQRREGLDIQGAEEG